MDPIHVDSCSTHLDLSKTGNFITPLITQMQHFVIQTRHKCIPQYFLEKLIHIHTYQVAHTHTHAQTLTDTHADVHTRTRGHTHSQCCVTTCNSVAAIAKASSKQRAYIQRQQNKKQYKLS